MENLLTTHLTEYFSSYDFVSGLLGMLAGTLFGHWLAIGRDKRKEFNQATETIRSSIKNILKNKTRSHLLRVNNPDGNDIEEYQPIYYRYQFHLLLSLYKAHINMHLNRDSYGDITFTGNSKYLYMLVWLMKGYVNRK